MRHWGVVLAVVVGIGCGGPPAPSGRPRNPGQTDTCDPHPRGLPGSFVVKYEGGFNYQPRGGNIQKDIREIFRTTLEEALVDSSVHLTEAQGQASDIFMFVSLMNDGADNFHVVVGASGAGAPSPGYLFVYTQPYTYTDVPRAISDAATTVARFLRDGWLC